MSVRVTHVQNEDRSFTLLAEQEVPVTVDEFDRVVGRTTEMGRWFGIDFTWPTCPDQQLEVGSAIEFKTPVGPISTSDFILIVADRVPGESLLLRTTRGAVDMMLEYSWEPSPGGARVTMRADFRVRGALWWKGPWTRTVAKRRLIRGLENMRRGLESSQQGVAQGSAAAAALTTPASAPRLWKAHPGASQRHRPQQV